LRIDRRQTLVLLAAFPTQLVATSALGQTGEIWSAADAFEALTKDRIRLLDIRSPEEWSETGVAELAWPVSLHDERFPERLFKAHELADGRPVAMICATGGRSGAVMRNLRRLRYEGFIDVSEGMLGSRAGTGWIKAGLPVVSAQVAIAALPDVLKS
jgi:rhodanese-related sulfurtransferase